MTPRTKIIASSKFMGSFGGLNSPSACRESLPATAAVFADRINRLRSEELHRSALSASCETCISTSSRTRYSRGQVRAESAQRSSAVRRLTLVCVTSRNHCASVFPALRGAPLRRPHFMRMLEPTVNRTWCVVRVPSSDSCTMFSILGAINAGQINEITATASSSIDTPSSWTARASGK